MRRPCPYSSIAEPEPAPTSYVEPFTVRVPEALRLTGIGRTKLYELIATGEVETVKVGRSRLVRVASLRRLTRHA